MGINWLISGGCGFIGCNLIANLVKNYPDVNIRILDNQSVGSTDDLESVCDYHYQSISDIHSSPQGVEMVEGDIRNADDCLMASDGIDVIIHLAANTGVQPSMVNPRFDLESNVFGVFNMLEAAKNKGISKFIFASSGAPLGEVEPPINEEKAPKPISPYGASKLAGEGYCSAYYRAFGLKTIALRFGNVYGPRSKHKNSVVAKYFKNAFKGKALEIYGNGNQTRDFIYIVDLIEAIMLGVLNDVRGEIFQISSHRETTVNEISGIIRDIMKEKEGIDVESYYSPERVGDMKRNYSDISKAKKYLGFEPKYSLREGLLRTYEFFKEYQKTTTKPSG